MQTREQEIKGIENQIDRLIKQREYIDWKYAQAGRESMQNIEHEIETLSVRKRELEALGDE